MGLLEAHHTFWEQALPVKYGKDQRNWILPVPFKVAPTYRA